MKKRFPSYMKPPSTADAGSRRQRGPILEKALNKNEVDMRRINEKFLQRNQDFVKVFSPKAAKLSESPDIKIN